MPTRFALASLAHLLEKCGQEDVPSGVRAALTRHARTLDGWASAVDHRQSPGIHLDVLLTISNGRPGEALQTHLYANSRDGSRYETADGVEGVALNNLAADLIEVARDHEADLTEPGPEALAEQVLDRTGDWAGALATLLALAQRAEEEK